MKRARVIAGLVTSVVAAAGVLAGTAGSAQAADLTSVTPYTNVNVRDAPTTIKSDVLFTFYAGDFLDAACWSTGQTISAHGYTNNVWIRLYNPGGSRTEWVSAVYLVGDSHADVPNHC